MRWAARNGDPGNGQTCRWEYKEFSDATYFWGWESNFSIGSNEDVRRC
jgi:hypothetical protein